MTNKEASEVIRKNYEITEALGVMLKANDRNIPKKQIYADGVVLCPNCNHILGFRIDDRRRYCHWCGQRLE